MHESRAIQHRIKQYKNKTSSQDSVAKRFANFMLKGQVQAAMRLLDDEEANGVIPLNDATLGTLRSQHPESTTPKEDALLHGTYENVNSIIYQSIDASVIQKAALHK